MELKRQIRVLESSKPKPQVDEKRTESVRIDSFNKGLKAESSRHAAEVNYYNKREKTFDYTLKKITNELQQFTIKCSKLLQIEIKEIPKQTVKELPKVDQKEAHPEQTVFSDDIKLNLCTRKIYSFLFQMLVFIHCAIFFFMKGLII